MNRLIAVFFIGFFSLPAFAQKPVYAEDMERDIQSKNALYTYDQNSGPEYVVFQDRDLQEEATCSLGSDLIIKAISIEGALPTNYLIWNNHAFYIRNIVLGEYFDGKKILKDLSMASDEDLGVLFADLETAYVKELIQQDISDSNETLTSKDTQLKSLLQYISENDGATTELQNYTQELKVEVEKLRESLKKLVDLQNKYFAVVSYEKNNVSHRKANRFIRKIEEKLNRMQTPEEFFKIFPDKKDEGVIFLEAFLKSSTQVSINNHPYQFEIVKNNGDEAYLCPVGETYWQLIVSEKINPYGLYTALIDFSKTN